MGRQTGSPRSPAIAAGVVCLLVACQQPTVGERVTAALPTEGPVIVLEDGQVDLHGRVVGTFSVTQDGIPLVLEEVKALDPRFTLATLSGHPVDGLRAWRSQLLTGTQTAKNLAPSGPGTPKALVLQNARQPGSETPASLVDLGAGRFRYVFANPLSSFDPDETIRIGVWLRGATAPSLRTSSAYDFRPSGGPMESRDVVTDEACNGCHANLVLHGTRTRVKLCLTCHTWQAADPDTIDPAAPTATSTTLDPAGAPTATSTASDPNPIEFARMVHRIHRGKNLPTLYQSSSSAVPAPALAAGNDLPLPFSPSTNTTPVVGQKYSIVGFRSAELVPGQVVQRAEGILAPTTMAAGIVFPRDLRDCGVCHAVPDAGGVPRQAYEVTSAISRRTCAGCHPDTWFGATPFADKAGPVHFPHPGGPQANDSACAGCHVPGAAGPQYARVDLAHAVPSQAPRNGFSRPCPTGNPPFFISKVSGLMPGSQPRVTFKLCDRSGPIAPQPKAPIPLWEPDSPTSSFAPRKYTSLAIRIVGPTDPDYGATTGVALSSGTSQPSGDPLSIWTGAGTDEYVYVFSTISPAAPQGTYAVAIEGRRQVAALTVAPPDPYRWPVYRKDLDLAGATSSAFLWPYTGETVNEAPDNALVYVDSGTGAFDAATAVTAGGFPASPGATPRRVLVGEANCLRCHGRFELHGSNRHQVQYCLLCHTPNGTDWGQRPGIAAARGFPVTGKVNLPATWDGIEERSIHFKVMVHRIHTGGRTGAATLEAIQPYLVYGRPGAVFFDEGLFPGNLASCPTCHVGKTYLVDAVPGTAPSTIANEAATLLHSSSNTPVAGEPATLPIQAACLGCHASGATSAHVASKTVDGVETCASCHVKGNLSVDVAHGLAPPAQAVASANFSSIEKDILVPRCATAACHAAGANHPVLEAGKAYAGLVNAASLQAGAPYNVLVVPSDTSKSYLVYKLRGDIGAAGGSGAIMPPDGSLPAADLAAIEAWIANGATQ